ncbi:Uncharacterised protein [Ewingella americana]|uniref:Uncharacterized protein n=1 Tax=Ewingella americana TaxID=41202 RepID=A0A377N9U6_9GAMM|nr:Uncharacterised protein [Ewingella americana]
MTGYIVQNTGRFDSAFMLAGGVAALGAILVFFVIKPPKHLPLERRDPVVNLPSPQTIAGSYSLGKPAF